MQTFPHHILILFLIILDLIIMFNLLEDPFLDDIVSRAEQSHSSYRLRTDEFRNLNTNLQIYLNDIKTIDDENRQLQTNIEQIRTNYISTLENHLKGLPEDFREGSNILTAAHLERYKSKSRAKRFLNERDEWKKRINFLVNNEKEQTKRLNQLQKQERFMENEFRNFNQQIQHLFHYVQKEKQTHQQAMTKVDQLQIQLEEISIERSKTEFEIQTLREEVKLMQTAKEFLDEEHQTILSTQTEANEYFLSRLNDSIARIREDFNELNQNQIKQIENEYQQMMTILEENSLTNQTPTSDISYEKLQDEHQIITQELTTLNEHHQNLSERIFVMEADLYSIRDERLRELISKDKELERSEIELQTLNDKLNHLAEYDRNLKFELTLYRGVLESESRRKQQQQLKINEQPIRPTTLRTTIIRSNKHSSKILDNRNQLEPINEKMNIQVNDEKTENKVESDEQDRNVTPQEQPQIPTESPILTVPTDQLASAEIQHSPRISPTNEEVILNSSALPPDLASSLNDSPTSLETPDIPTSPTDATLVEGQLPIASSEVQRLPESSPANEEPSFTSAAPVSSEDPQTSSSIPPLTDQGIPSAAQESSPTLAAFEDQPASSALSEDQQGSFPTLAAFEDQQGSFPTLAAFEDQQGSFPTLAAFEDQPASSALSEDQQESSTNPAVFEDQPASSAPPEDQQESSTNPAVFEDQTASSAPPEDQQESSTTPAVFEDQPVSSAPPEDQQESSTTLAVFEDQPASSAPPEDQQEPSVVSGLSTISITNEEIISETEKSSISPTSATPATDLSSSTLPDDHPTEADVHQPSNISSTEQTMPPESSNTPLQEDRSISPDILQKVSTPSPEQPAPLEIQQPSITDETIDKQSSSETTEEYRPVTPTIEEADGENQLGDVSDGYDNLIEDEEKTVETDDIANDHPPSTHSTERSTAYEDETNQTTTITEEPVSSSDQNQFEKDNTIDYTSSTDYDGTKNDSNHFTSQELSKTSLSDADGDKIDITGEVDSSTSPKIDENSESNFEAIMQDLRYVYRSLVNDEDLVEINDDFLDKLIDRPEFGEYLIRTSFDHLLQKYLAQAKTLDWIEFRDLLFPILTGRYTEGHMRKLFHLYDIHKNGDLSLEEITELFELLRVNTSNQLTNESGKSNVDEFIEVIKNSDEGKNHILPNDIEYAEWYIQSPINEENTQSISSEVPNANFPSKISNGIPLLNRIFKRLGPDVKNKQLDSHKPTLSMQITNEFIHNNIHISNDDLQTFIELHLNKKQNSDLDSAIEWNEFRDLFLPFVNGGMVSKDDLTRWFDILDTNQNKTITHEQILHLFRLLQIPNPEEILNKIPPNDNNTSYTLEELISTLENTTTRLVSINDII